MALEQVFVRLLECDPRVRGVRVTYDNHGTPGVVAATDVAAQYGLGLVHGRHRPLQALLLTTAGRGALSKHLLPLPDLVRIDALVHRLDLPRRGEEEAARLTPWTKERLNAYLDGLKAGLAEAGKPFELRAVFASLPPPTAGSVIGGFLLGAYLGLAEGQERMERAVVDALSAGADPKLLEQMFTPHLEGWDPTQLQHVARAQQDLPLGFAAHGLTTSGGSNAWCVSGSRSKSGHAMLAGDPHLQINQLPSLFMEVAVRLEDDFWLGATIPGLPGIAIGRNRNVSWSGTFAVADNVDFFIEEVEDYKVRERNGLLPLVHRTVEIGRRFRRPPLLLTFYESARGTVEQVEDFNGQTFSVAWSGSERAADAIEAYLLLPTARTAKEAEDFLDGAHTMSLHFVIADRDGDIRYRQVGRIPRRSNSWSGLYPVPALGERAWIGTRSGVDLPKLAAPSGFLATANEARLAEDGGVLSTLAQPPYRLARIQDALRSRNDHDVESFKELQLDLHSPQAKLLKPFFVHALPTCALKQALIDWDECFTVDSHGAHAFSLAYRAALTALEPELGGDWLSWMVSHSELSVWWCTGFDRILSDVASWQGERGTRLRKALHELRHLVPARWGDAQQMTMRNMVLGGVSLGFDRGPFSLPGSIATVCQGNLVSAGKNTIAVAPVYRFITDLGEEAAYTSLPGGIDGSRFSKSYTYWLEDYFRGHYHRLVPPSL